jgi:hypothetical protein
VDEVRPIPELRSDEVGTFGWRVQHSLRRGVRDPSARDGAYLHLPAVQWGADQCGGLRSGEHVRFAD